MLNNIINGARTFTGIGLFYVGLGFNFISRAVIEGAIWLMDDSDVIVIRKTTSIDVEDRDGRD
jgi:hypothetical protein